MSKKDMEEFNAYLKTLTDPQVREVLAKERSARRTDYAALASAEMARRKLY